jgi:hypothetical protein
MQMINLRTLVGLESQEGGWKIAIEVSFLTNFVDPKNEQFFWFFSVFFIFKIANFLEKKFQIFDIT